jgi:hypothetical protein
MKPTATPTDRGLDAGGEHVDAGLDRHDPGVGDAGQVHRRVELVDESLVVIPGRHSSLGFELDQGLDHRQRRRVGGRVGAPDLAEHPLDLRDLHDQPIGLLQQLLCLADREAGQGRRHVHQVALVEFGHELRAEAAAKRASPGCPRKVRFQSLATRPAASLDVCRPPPAAAPPVSVCVELATATSAAPAGRRCRRSGSAG